MWFCLIITIHEKLSVKAYKHYDILNHPKCIHFYPLVGFATDFPVLLCFISFYFISFLRPCLYKMK